MSFSINISSVFHNGILNSIALRLLSSQAKDADEVITSILASGRKQSAILNCLIESKDDFDVFFEVVRCHKQQHFDGDSSQGELFEKVLILGIALRQYLAQLLLQSPNNIEKTSSKFFDLILIVKAKIEIDKIDISECLRRLELSDFAAILLANKDYIEQINYAEELNQAEIKTYWQHTGFANYIKAIEGLSAPLSSLDIPLLCNSLNLDISVREFDIQCSEGKGKILWNYESELATEDTSLTLLRTMLGNQMEYSICSMPRPKFKLETYILEYRFYLDNIEMCGISGDLPFTRQGLGKNSKAIFSSAMMAEYGQLFTSQQQVPLVIQDLLKLYNKARQSYKRGRLSPFPLIISLPYSFHKKPESSDIEKADPDLLKCLDDLMVYMFDNGKFAFLDRRRDVSGYEDEFIATSYYQKIISPSMGNPAGYRSQKALTNHKMWQSVRLIEQYLQQNYPKKYTTDLFKIFRKDLKLTTRYVKEYFYVLTLLYAMLKADDERKSEVADALCIFYDEHFQRHYAYKKIVREHEAFPPIFLRQDSIAQAISEAILAKCVMQILCQFNYAPLHSQVIFNLYRFLDTKLSLSIEELIEVYEQSIEETLQSTNRKHIDEDLPKYIDLELNKRAYQTDIPILNEVFSLLDDMKEPESIKPILLFKLVLIELYSTKDYRYCLELLKVASVLNTAISAENRPRVNYLILMIGGLITMSSLLVLALFELSTLAIGLAVAGLAISFGSFLARLPNVVIEQQYFKRIENAYGIPELIETLMPGSDWDYKQDKESVLYLEKQFRNAIALNAFIKNYRLEETVGQLSGVEIRRVAMLDGMVKLRIYGLKLAPLKSLAQKDEPTIKDLSEEQTGGLPLELYL